MPDRPLKILLIEDNAGDARLIREMLSEAKEAKFDLERSDRLSSGLDRLAKGDIDIVLLDLSLPDSHGLDTFRKTHGNAPDIVIIVLTGYDDVETGTKAVQEGAQDYLIKGKVDGTLLVRSICYAVERQRMLKELKAMSYTDDLTGLYNRRGLSMTGEELLKLAKRIAQVVFFMFVDLDGMKWINDNLGHQEGDVALKDTADLLRLTFRESDIIARIGGDEFVVLGISNSETTEEIITSRFNHKLDTYNGTNKRPYKLSMSMGIVTYGSNDCPSMNELLVQADKLMYEKKRARRTLNSSK